MPVDLYEYFTSACWHRVGIPRPKNNDPVIASTEDQQLVICVMIGTNGSDLLTFWSNSDWIATSD